MFEKGEYMIHGYNGICRVMDVTGLDMPGINKERLYYILEPLNDKEGKVYSPVDNQSVTVRKILTKTEAKQLMDLIPEVEEFWTENHKMRDEMYKSAMKTCETKEWLKIVKTLYAKKREKLTAGKKLSAVDDKYYHMAEDHLCTEIGLALGKTKTDVAQLLEIRFTQLIPFAQ